MAEMIRDLDKVQAKYVELLGSVAMARIWYKDTQNDENATFGERMKDLRRQTEIENRLAVFEAMYSLPLPEVDLVELDEVA